MADVSMEALMVALPIMKFTTAGQRFMDDIIMDELCKEEEDDKPKKEKATTKTAEDEYVEVVLDVPSTPPILIPQERTAPTKMQKRKAQNPRKIPSELKANMIMEERRKHTKNMELKRLLESKPSSGILPAPRPVYPSKAAALPSGSKTAQPVDPDEDIVTDLFLRLAPLLKKHPKLARSKELETLVRQVLSTNAPNLNSVSAQLLNAAFPTPSTIACSLGQLPYPFPGISHQFPPTLPASSSSMPLFPNMADLPGTSAGCFPVNGELEAQRRNPVLYAQIMKIIEDRNSRF